MEWLMWPWKCTLSRVREDGEIMKSVDAWTEIAFSEYEHPGRSDVSDVIRKVRVEALQHAANLARMGKMDGLRDERDRGHNLALDMLVENLEQRIKEIEKEPK